MSRDTQDWSKVEQVKQASRFLRGEISEELAKDSNAFEEDTALVLKHHGIYQQDDRDLRGKAGPGGDRAWIMMVRVKIPGGRLTCHQWLGLTRCAEEWGNQTLRITTRQDIQFHGVLKKNLAALIREVRALGLTTLGGCGDVVRNVISCPAPVADGGIRDQVYEDACRITEHFLPRGGAYDEVWTEGSAPQREIGPPEQMEPIYGTNYLPRKFKIAFSLPDDNCTDVYADDLGFLAIVENGSLIGYQVLVGGGLGVTPADKSTFPALAQPVTFIRREELVPMTEAVVKLYRDYGNRSNRKRARIKYVLADWGMEKFRAELGRYFGRELDPPPPVVAHRVETHLGWHLQPDGRWFYGLYVENGRVADTPSARMKTALREICERLRPGIRLTATWRLLITDVEAGNRSLVESILRDHGVRLSEEISPLRHFSGACVALPTCGLAITESERALPGILDQLEQEMAKLGLANFPICVHMTGCPNGCGRPYNAEVGIVGRAKDRYAIFLGGSMIGHRLGFLYENLVPRDRVASVLARVLEVFVQSRSPGESFGDFCARLGADGLRSAAGA
jgi:sulfite reductase (ferredoxin)